MKLKPDDDIRNSEPSIMTLTTTTTGDKSELVKQIIAHSDMGHKGKVSQPSLEESSPQTTTNKEGTEESKSSSIPVLTESMPKENCTNHLPCKDGDDAGDDSVDVLVNGLKECQIGQEVKSEVDSGTKEISDGLVQLCLEESDEENEKKEAGIARRQGPEEDDESEALESLGQKEEKQASAAGTQESQGKQTKEEVKMVKLEVPCKEEEEEEEGSSDTETDVLKERGPNGIPVYHSYRTSTQLPQTFNFGSQDGIPNGLCDQNSWAFLPNNNNSNNNYTTSYDCQPQLGLHQMSSVMGGKRGINDLDFDEEAPKFFRPQVDPQLATVNGYNNLDAPGQPNNKLKSINKVCHRQMSGGTVTTNNTASLGMNGANLGSLTNRTVPLQQQTDRLDSVELQEILNLHNFESEANDGVFDIEELLDGSGQIQDSQGCVPQNDPITYQQQQQQNLHYQHLQQHQKQTFALPAGQNLNMSAQNNLTYPHPQQAQMGVGSQNGCMKIHQQQMPVSKAPIQFQLLQEVNARILLQQGLASPGNGMTHIEDPGYISPNHETQFPLTPSPLSVIATSPDPASGSPPQQNWSPPPSNLSMFSQDSGVFSPSADFGEQQDDFGNYSTFVDEHLHDLEDALKVAEEDLRKKMDLQDGSVQGVTVNIPSTVPQDIMTSPSLQHSPEPLFRDAPSSAQTGKPVAVAVRRTAAKKPAAKGPVAEVRKTSGQVTEGPAFNKIIVSQPAAAASPAAALVISSPAALTPTSPPLVNSQGKVAIPPSRQKPRVIQGTAVVPCVLTSNGITPVFVLPPEKPRYPAIAPKAPSKPAEPLQSTNVRVISPPVEVQSPKIKTTKRSPTVKDKLNIARRAVAELHRNDLTFKDQDGDTPLHIASVQTDECMIESIMERLVREELSFMVNAQNHMGQTALYLAVCENKPEMVEVLVRYEADVKPFAEVTLDSGTREKSSAIHRASSKGEGYLRTLKELLKSPSIDLNQMNSEGHTALHCAILCHGKKSLDNKVINSIPIIEALIEAGADPNLQVQKNGKTGLMFVLESRNLDLIESTFRLIDPVKLPAYLKTESFDGNTCHRIASSLKTPLCAADQQRLSRCLKPQAASRLDH